MTAHVEPLPRTHLSLFRYAQIMGIAPLHFAGASTPSLSTEVFPGQGCDSYWPRYSWQDADQVSHEDLAQSIRDAEQEIAAALGYPVAPEWVVQETQPWPRHHRRDLRAIEPYVNLRNRWSRPQVTETEAMVVNAKFKTSYAKVNTAGPRAVSLIGTATVAGAMLVYSDEDGDGYSETATITLSTSLTSTEGVKVYFAGKSGAQAWEIRPLWTMTISDDTLTITAPSWLFIKPELLAAFPTADGRSAIDVITTTNFVTSVDVYREYTDSTATSAKLLWSATDDCVGCGITEQSGCLSILNAELGMVAPMAATYSDGAWTRTAWTRGWEPDQTQFWYQAGEWGEEYLRGESLDPLSDWLARPIAWIATARLERSFCQCGNLTALADHLREDLSKSSRDASYMVNLVTLDNPFGTKRGEVMAWQRISKLAKAIGDGGVL